MKNTTNIFNITHKIFKTIFSGADYAKFSVYNTTAYDKTESIHPFLLGEYAFDLPLDKFEKEDYYNYNKWDLIESYLKELEEKNSWFPNNNKYLQNFFKLKLNFYLFCISIQNEKSHLGTLYIFYNDLKRNPSLENIHKLQDYYDKMRLIYVNLDTILPYLHDNIINLIQVKRLKFSMRDEPVWFNFCGEAGIGKSLITKKIAEVLADHYSEKPYYHISHKEQSKDFYDNYDSQKVMVYDDLGQKSTSEFSNFVQMISPNPYALNCAQAENKGSKFLENYFFISSTNMSTIRNLRVNPPVSDPLALFRRMFEVDMSHVIRNEDNTYKGRVYVNKYDIKGKHSIFEFNMNKGLVTFIKYMISLIYKSFEQKKLIINEALNFSITLDEVLNDQEISTVVDEILKFNTKTYYDKESKVFIADFGLSDFIKEPLINS